jgi:hypothetical protein
MPIDLRAPTGERIELGGPWTEVTTGGEPMSWWIRTSGNCIWGTGQVPNVSAEGSFEGAPHEVQSFNGHIGSDFMITGDIVNLGPIPRGAPRSPSPVAPLEMLIEFDDESAITLREARAPGERGPRCPEPGAYCPAPLVLQPID